MTLPLVGLCTHDGRRAPLLIRVTVRYYGRVLDVCDGVSCACLCVVVRVRGVAVVDGDDAEPGSPVVSPIGSGVAHVGRTSTRRRTQTVTGTDHSHLTTSASHSVNVQIVRSVGQWSAGVRLESRYACSWTQQFDISSNPSRQDRENKTEAFVWCQWRLRTERVE